ncbi:MAG TPA: TonB-dependent receptor, partial [Longimicrobium sp.]|nr:TonB-dependent receptor [Longimicrobium sp.]
MTPLLRLRPAPARWRAATLRVAALLLAATPTRELAAQQPDSVVRLEGVVVRGTRAATTVGGTSALVVRADSLAAGTAAPTMEQVLREMPFVGVRENSRGEAEITLRGSESRQVAVLVDGVPLTLGWDSRTNPSIIPLSGARTLVLVRGLHSVLHGPNVLGGVVEVSAGETASPAPVPREWRVRTGFDHLGSAAVGASAATGVRIGAGTLALRAGGGLRDRPGYALPGGVRDTLTGDADLRANSDARLYDAFASLRYDGDAGQWLGLSASGYRAERGVPPELHVEEPRLWRYPRASRLLAVLSGGTGYRDTPLGRGDVEASVGLDVGRTDIDRYDSRAYRDVVGQEDGDDRTLTARLLADHTLGRFASWRGALTWADVEHRERIPPDPEATYRQRLWSAGSEVTVALGGAAHLAGGLAWDGADTPEAGGKPALRRLDAWGGRLGASTLALGGRVRLHAAVNRRVRFPSLRELYSGALGRFIPNPELRPERLLGAEAGVTADLGAVQLQAVAYRHRLFDAVARVARDGRFIRVNREEMRSTGLELLAGWRRGGWELQGDALLQEVQVFDSTAASGRRRAEHTPELRAGIDARIPLPLQVRGLLNASYTGRQFCVHPDLGTEVVLGAAARADAGVSRAWRLRRGGSLGATLLVENLADAAVYDQCGLPQPGRTLRLSIEIGRG